MIIEFVFISTAGRKLATLCQSSGVLVGKTFIVHEIQNLGNSLAVQWLGLQVFTAFTAEGTGSIPGGGTKIPHTKPGKCSCPSCGSESLIQQDRHPARHPEQNASRGASKGKEAP